MLARLLPLFVSAALLGLAADIPRPAPDFPIPLPDGQTIKTANYKGKVLIVEFLVTTCPGCQNGARILTRLRNEFGPKGFEVLGIATNPGADKGIGNFVQKTGATFPIGYRTLDAAKTYLQIPVMVNMMVPQFVFIDRAGTIRSQHGGDDQFFFLEEERNIRKELTALLAEGKAPITAAPAAGKAPSKKK